MKIVSLIKFVKLQVAQENKIFHKGVNLSAQIQCESLKNLQSFNYKSKFLLEKYEEITQVFLKNQNKENHEKNLEEDVL